MSLIHIFTDGSCNVIDGSGGWGFVMVRRSFDYHLRHASGEEIDKIGRGPDSGDKVLTFSGARSDTTTNEMELTAIFRSLQFLHREERDEEGNLEFRKVRIYTDSSYSKGCLTKWMKGWMQTNWVNSYGDPVKNQKIIRPSLTLIRDLRSKMLIRICKVKGHSGEYFNEVADELAGNARKNALQ